MSMLVADLREEKYVGFIIPAISRPDERACAIRLPTTDGDKSHIFLAVPIEAREGKNPTAVEIERLIGREGGEYLMHDPSKHLAKTFGICEIISDNKSKTRNSLACALSCSLFAPMYGDVAFLKYKS